MKVKAIMRYTDTKLNTEKFPGDTFTVDDSRGKALIRAGYVEEVRDYGEVSEVEQPRRGRRQS